MGRIVVIGSTNTDMVVRAPQMPLPGETLMGKDFNVVAGGKGANQAVASARARGRVTFITKVGSDEFGEKAKAGLEADSIDTTFVYKDTQTPSGVAIIIVDDKTGQNSIVVTPGANAALSVDDIEKAEPAIAEADILLVQLEIPLGAVEIGLQLAKKHKVTTILNPAPAQQLSADILNNVDIITPNETETHILTGINPLNENDMAEAGRKLLDYVNQAVIITLGNKGAFYVTKNKDSGIIPTTSVGVTDTTAAGDVFNGYLAAFLAENIPIDRAIGIANKAASISVTRNGAQPSIPFHEEL